MAEHQEKEIRLCSLGVKGIHRDESSSPASIIQPRQMIIPESLSQAVYPEN